MSYTEENRERRSNRLRTTMDIMMGLFYTLIGAMLLYARSFVGVQVPPLVAYILGGMMAIGGVLRLYRGIKAILPQKNKSDQLG